MAKIFNCLDGIATDEVIKYCKTCKKCWEQLRMNVTENNKSGDKQFITYYEDFPTYGKGRKTCHQCNGNTKSAQLLKGLVVHEITQS
jgi:hypothetical protein